MSLIKDYTTFSKFALLNFDFPRWGDEHNRNMQRIDAILRTLGIPTIKGFWANATSYVVGDRVADTEQGGIYVAQTNHTSPSTGSFADDRAANPTRWQLSGRLPTFRNNWLTGTVYQNNEIVVVNTYQYYYCVLPHTSGTFATDLSNGRWQLIFDAGPAVAEMIAQVALATARANDANNSAIAAAASLTATQIIQDQIDDLYLGPKASNPLTDNDGNALQAGAFCLNTTLGRLQFWTGSAWINPDGTAAPPTNGGDAFAYFMGVQ